MIHVGEKRSNPVKIFYFLKPNMHGKLILQSIVSIRDDLSDAPRSTNYILEEQLGNEDTPISLLTHRGEKLYGNRSRDSMKIRWMDGRDRLNNLGATVVKLLGYDMTTTPTASEILQNTKMQYSMEFKRLLSADDNYTSSLDSASPLGNYMRKRKLSISKPKRKVCSCKKKK